MISIFPPAPISQHNKRIILPVFICIHIECIWGTSEVQRTAPIVAVKQRRPNLDFEKFCVPNPKAGVPMKTPKFGRLGPSGLGACVPLFMNSGFFFQLDLSRKD